MKVVLFSLAILLAEANPIELPARILSQTCGDYEWFNPRANTCQGFAVPSSCGLLAKTCGSGEYCTNNDGWSKNAMGIRNLFLFSDGQIGIVVLRDKFSVQPGLVSTIWILWGVAVPISRYIFL
jgi:hypothetical protein